MAEQYTVYVVEDDTHIRELLLYNLQAAGYRVQGFASGEDALQVTFQHAPDVMLLDLMLPGLDGMEICRRIRAQESCKSVRVIMVTARGEEVDRVLGLELGADDYIVKPFSIREVLARVKAVLRRYSYETDPSATHLLSTPEFSIDAEKRVVMRGSEVLHLPLKEFDLLYYLMSRPDRVLTREQLLDQVWGYDFVGETRTVDVHIRHLRMKLEKDPDHPVYIQTVRGVGYRFVQGV